jgi:hypothetical protein
MSDEGMEFVAAELAGIDFGEFGAEQKNLCGVIYP